MFRTVALLTCAVLVSACPSLGDPKKESQIWDENPENTPAEALVTREYRPTPQMIEKAFKEPVVPQVKTNDYPPGTIICDPGIESPKGRFAMFSKATSTLIIRGTIQEQERAIKALKSLVERKWLFEEGELWDKDAEQTPAASLIVREYRLPKKTLSKVAAFLNLPPKAGAAFTHGGWLALEYPTSRYEMFDPATSTLMVNATVPEHQRIRQALDKLARGK